MSMVVISVRNMCKKATFLSNYIRFRTSINPVISSPSFHPAPLPTFYLHYFVLISRRQIGVSSRRSDTNRRCHARRSSHYTPDTTRVSTLTTQQPAFAPLTDVQHQTVRDASPFFILSWKMDFTIESHTWNQHLSIENYFTSSLYFFLTFKIHYFFFYSII